MKYNRVEIFNTAWRLAKNYNMDMSAALTKAWSMAKLEILKNELFGLNMYSPNGGANNIIAQNEIRIHEEKISAVKTKIDELKNRIYPKIAIVEENATVKFMKAAIIRNEAMLASITKESDRQEIIKSNDDMKKQIEKLEKESAVYYQLDTNAYKAA